MTILEISQKQPFDIIAMTPRGTLGLCCVHIAQLMTHPAVYTLPFTLQLCYKPLVILQRVTKKLRVKRFIYQLMMDSKNLGSRQNVVIKENVKTLTTRPQLPNIFPKGLKFR